MKLQNIIRSWLKSIKQVPHIFFYRVFCILYQEGPNPLCTGKERNKRQHRILIVCCFRNDVNYKYASLLESKESPSNNI